MNAPWIIKIGSALTRSECGELDRDSLDDLVEQAVALQQSEHPLVVVSSGAVAAGHGVLGDGITSLRDDVIRRQLYAAVGQTQLMRTFGELFGSRGYQVAQILATRQDFSTRRHYLNMRSCLVAALQQQVVPIINENDVVSVTELMFTDNDELAALVAGMLGAEKLVILSDVDGVYDGPPEDPASRVIGEWDNHTLRASPNPRSEFGRGGIHTKVRNATRLSQLGTEVWIVNGRSPDVLRRVADGESVGTRFAAHSRPSQAKRWVAAAPNQEAEVIINEGAEQVLRSPDRLASLLPVGIEKVEGDFKRGDVIRVLGPGGNVVGYGRAEYSSLVANRLIGQQRQKPLIHYDYLYVFPSEN
ncbi:MAG: glutamate 5-kinase [Xanthomonadales bacterium]|nr:glutamate 5-kinase [Xanthomonadales bacterium]